MPHTQAGTYAINSSLNVMSSARAGYARPGPGYAKFPLRLVGDGHNQAIIVAAVGNLHVHRASFSH